MPSLSYLRSLISTWFLNQNPAVRDFYMRQIRHRYLEIAAKLESSQWKAMNLPLLTSVEVTDRIGHHLREGGPYTAAKIGANELFLLQWSMGESISRSRMEALHHHAGLFPCDPDFLKEYGRVFAEGVRSLDLLGLWTGKGEPGLYRKMELGSEITPYQNFAGDFGSIAYGQWRGWYPELRGKQVMVISSFADLINRRANEASWSEYWGDRFPWPDPASVKAVGFPYGFEKGTQDMYRDSLHLLESFKTENQDALEQADIVLAGCGAYAIPILHWARQHGKVAIHLGGDIQILFGIKGGRWDSLGGLYNDHWVRPDESMTPESASSIENACYW